MQALALRLGASGCAVLVLAGASFAQHMERGAFLRKPVNSRSQLVAQLNSDPIVSARYQKHFAMSEDKIERYFSGMTTSTLPSSGRYLVWHVDPNGKQETKWLNLKKGTKVFVDESGRIALKLNCGNPMVDQTVAKRTMTPATPRVASVPPTPVVEEAFVPETPPVVALVPPPAVAVPEVVAGVPPAPVIVETATVPSPAVVAAVPPQISSGGGGGLGILPFLLLGGAIAGGGGGGGGGGVVPPPAAPEPATMLALGAGLVAVVARRRKRS